MNESRNSKVISRLCMTAVMAALVAVGSWIQIQIPSILGTSRFHLGNVMCALSDLLLDPTRFAEFPITFITKGVYGLVAGAVFFHVFKGRSNYVSEVVASALAAVSYIAIYLAKSFFYNGLFIKGLTAQAAWLGVLEKIPSSLFNGIVAVVFAPILGVAIHKALKSAHLDRLTAAGG